MATKLPKLWGRREKILIGILAMKLPKMEKKEKKRKRNVANWQWICQKLEESIASA